MKFALTANSAEFHIREHLSVKTVTGKTAYPQEIVKDLKAN